MKMVGSGLTIDAATGKLSADSSSVTYDDPNGVWKSIISKIATFSFSFPDNSVAFAGQLVFAFQYSYYTIFGVRLSKFSMSNSTKKTYSTGYIESFDSSEIKPKPFNLKLLPDIYYFDQNDCFLSFPSINGLKIVWRTYYSPDMDQCRLEITVTDDDYNFNQGTTYMNENYEWADLAIGIYAHQKVVNFNPF